MPLKILRSSFYLLIFISSQAYASVSLTINAGNQSLPSSDFIKYSLVPAVERDQWNPADITLAYRFSRFMIGATFLIASSSSRLRSGQDETLRNIFLRSDGLTAGVQIWGPGYDMKGFQVNALGFYGLNNQFEVNGQDVRFSSTTGNGILAEFNLDKSEAKETFVGSLQLEAVWYSRFFHIGLNGGYRKIQGSSFKSGKGATAYSGNGKPVDLDLSSTFYGLTFGTGF